MTISKGGDCFDKVLPNILWLTRRIREMHYTETLEGVHVVINNELHLCETEALAIAVLDSNVDFKGELYVYCDETTTLILQGIGIVTELADCIYHIREILDAQIKTGSSYTPTAASLFDSGSVNDGQEGDKT